MPIPDTKSPVQKRRKQDFPAGPMLRRIEEFEEEDVRPETVYRLPEARVVFANHELIQHDFPHLRDDKLEQIYPELQNLVGADKRLVIQFILDNWLRTNVAFISENQAKQSVVNTPIKTTAQKFIAFRPPLYGRALVFSLKENYRRLFGRSDSGRGAPEGLLDAKGTGVGPHADPSQRRSKDGLMSLEEAFYEVVYQEALNKVFRHAGSPYWSVPSYGVLDLGFDSVTGSGLGRPAGMLVRRAHRRVIYRWGIKEIKVPSVSVELEIELLLRKYGITSAGPLTTIQITNENDAMVVRYGSTILSLPDRRLEWVRAHTGFKGEKQRFEGMHIQFTREVGLNPPRPQIIDFGGFHVKKKFEHPIVSLVTDHPVRLGEIIYPDSPCFVQPDETVCLPYEFWGTTGEIWGHQTSDPDPTDNLSLLGGHLARAFRDRKITGSEVRKQLDAFIETATSRWD